MRVAVAQAHEGTARIGRCESSWRTGSALRGGGDRSSATEDHSVRFHQYHLEDMARVRVRKFCEVEDREVRPG
ncbi:hypothetical protein AB0D59_24630 [Streptomyces sp. NPDC048417]|uniref:hypothetical protein n=1 Tax=Streptomyces sp. NPDC048417 TaxID=3155387 RepID=UPI003425AC2B